MWMPSAQHTGRSHSYVALGLLHIIHNINLLCHAIGATVWVAHVRRASGDSILDDFVVPPSAFAGFIFADSVLIATGFVVIMARLRSVDRDGTRRLNIIGALYLLGGAFRLIMDTQWQDYVATHGPAPDGLAATPLLQSFATNSTRHPDPLPPVEAVRQNPYRTFDEDWAILLTYVLFGALAFGGMAYYRYSQHLLNAIRNQNRGTVGGCERWCWSAWDHASGHSAHVEEEGGDASAAQQARDRLGGEGGDMQVGAAAVLAEIHWGVGAALGALTMVAVVHTYTGRVGTAAVSALVAGDAVSAWGVFSFWMQWQRLLRDETSARTPALKWTFSRLVLWTFTKSLVDCSWLTYLERYHSRTAVWRLAYIAIWSVGGWAVFMFARAMTMSWRRLRELLSFLDWDPTRISHYLEEAHEEDVVMSQFGGGGGAAEPQFVVGESSDDDGASSGDDASGSASGGDQDKLLPAQSKGWWRWPFRRGEPRQYQKKKKQKQKRRKKQAPKKETRDEATGDDAPPAVTVALPAEPPPRQQSRKQAADLPPADVMATVAAAMADQAQRAANGRGDGGGSSNSDGSDGGGPTSGGGNLTKQD